MTHVCRSWRNTLLSTPTLWTQIDFSMSTKFQQKSFLSRSGNQPLHLHHYLDDQDNIQPFLSIALHNLFRLQELSITSCLFQFESLLRMFSAAAPELKHLELANDPNITEMDVKLPTIFGGRMPKLEILKLHAFQTNLRDFSLPSLTRFTFSTGAKISVQDFTSFFERCPSLEFVQISLDYVPCHEPIAPPHRRVYLAALQELRLDQTACTTGILDHLILPKCTMLKLKGEFTGVTVDSHGYHAARIHPSSIDHIAVMRGITKAVAMPNSCTFSGPNGNLSFWCFEARKNCDAHFFTSFSPISISQIRELWIGGSGQHFLSSANTPWKQTTAGVRGAFEVLTTVEHLTLVSCETKPILTTLQATVDSGVLLPKLKKLRIYVGFGDLDVSALTQCVKTRKEYAQALEEVIVVWKKRPGADVVQGVATLRESVGKLAQRVGKIPKLSWSGGW